MESLAQVTETYLDKYLLNGGWSMLLLVPFSVVALAVSLRCLLALRTAAVAPLAEQLRVRFSTPTFGGKATLEDRRAQAYDAALQLYALLQPLWALFVLAPLVGLAGSITNLMGVFERTAANPALLIPELQHALVPPMWGVAISAFCYTAAAICRARVFNVESDILQPAAMDALETPGTEAE